MTKHLHNVVECPLTQMRNQGSCFQINTYCFKKKLNGKQCFLLYPLAVLSILFGLVLFFNFFRLTTGSACFLYTYLCIFLLLVENKFYIICFKLCHFLFFAMDIENKFYICSSCIASFSFLVSSQFLKMFSHTRQSQGVGGYLSVHFLLFLSPVTFLTVISNVENKQTAGSHH